jgi:hypothetical protein
VSARPSIRRLRIFPSIRPPVSLPVLPGAAFDLLLLLTAVAALSTRRSVRLCVCLSPQYALQPIEVLSLGQMLEFGRAALHDPSKILTSARHAQREVRQCVSMSFTHQHTARPAGGASVGRCMSVTHQRTAWQVRQCVGMSVTRIAGHAVARRISMSACQLHAWPAVQWQGTSVCVGISF